VPRDVYCYFDNTDKLHAPPNARRLMRLLESGFVEGAAAGGAAARAEEISVTQSAV